MIRLTAITLVVVLIAAALALARGAQADVSEYGIETAEATVSAHQAGGHPDFTTTIFLKREPNNELPAATRDTVFELPPGLLGNPTAVPVCSLAQFASTNINDPTSGCPVASQVGITEVELFNNGGIQTFTEPVYNIEPGFGEPARLGLIAKIFPILVNTRLRSGSDYGATAAAEEIGSLVPLLAATTTIWGVPADESHDNLRITPYEAVHNGGAPETLSGLRSAGILPRPFMLNPTHCGDEQGINFVAIPYPQPDLRSEVFAPLGPNVGCGLLDFSPSMSISPTTTRAEAGTGLDVGLSFPTEGFEGPSLNAEDEQKTVEVTLPEGMTVNPSEADGLGACSEADFKRETASSMPGEGCPESSKIGTVTAKSPLLEEQAEGALYIATPHENPFGTLIALYMVLKIPDRGVIVKLPGKVVTDPSTGQLTATFGEAPYEIPQLPVAAFHLHFREGDRSPLVTPRECGTYTATAVFTSWGEHVVTTHPSFQVTQGVNGGPCPGGGEPPLKPVLVAGTTSNAAAHYSPFYMRLSREDGEQEISRFSAKLPPGVTGKLAGIPLCPDSAIEAARARTGAEELEHPSCPAASELGHTLAGAGVGPVLAYAPGKVYLAGPFDGSPISIVAITAAKVGPFDLGTVVVRETLAVAPETGEVLVGGEGSEAIPHIIDGIPIRLRDIRAYVDRPEFILNPTSCNPMSTVATVFGAGLDFVSPADDLAASASSRFQAAECARLRFKPKMKFSLRGKTNRGAAPALRAEVTQKSGEASIGRAQVILPRSEFLYNAHIGTSCTRVEFNAGAILGEQCPAASVYGHARAFTPILGEPLEGPVFLRSNGSERELPDLVAALRNREVEIALVGFIDSVNGRTRARFQTVPDAPVSKFIISMAGGRKGLLQNSTNICRGTHRATVKLIGHNGKRRNVQPVVWARCK
jgi:hypothetical protein